MLKQIKDIAITRTASEPGDFLILQTPMGETYKIKKEDFLAGLSSGGGTDGSPNSTGYNFVSFGDTNGIVYAIGSNKNTAIFSNPSLDNRVVVSSSSILNNNDFTKVLSRNPGISHTLNGGNQWLQIDFGASQKVKITKYTLQGRNDFEGHHLRNWEIQASDDAATWNTLDTQSNNPSIGMSTWFGGSIVSASFYRYLKLIQTGTNSSGDTYLTLGQLDFYGNLE